MPKAFVNDVGGFIGSSIVRALLAQEYDVVGTLRKNTRAPKGVSRTVPATKRKSVESLMMEADVLVWSLEGQLKETKSAVRYLQKNILEGEKTLLIISSALVWEKSKRSGEPFKEIDYRTRHPPDFMVDYKSVESQALAIRKSKLRVVVVGAGLLYGRGESALHYLFRGAWMEGEGYQLPIMHGHQRQCEGESYEVEGKTEGKDEEKDGGENKNNNVVIFTNGHNQLPMIHADDLGSCVAALADNPPEDLDYVVAVDAGKSTFRDIVQSISSTLNSGGICDLSENDTAEFLLTNIDAEKSASVLTCNVSFDAENSYAHTALNGVQWVSKDGIVANIDDVVAQFKEARKLDPVRIVLIGPPSVAKGQVAAQLAQEYYVPLLTKQSVIAEVGRKMRINFIPVLCPQICLSHPAMSSSPSIHFP